MTRRTTILSEEQLQLISKYVPLAGGSGREYHVLGIDLGTTNSTATHIYWSGIADEEPEVRVLSVEQPTERGFFRSALVPSVVFRHADGTTWVGEGARDLLRKVGTKGIIPERTIFSETKNDIGTPLTYPGAPADLKSPTAAAGHILRFLREEATRELPSGSAFDRIVVTVPASFTLQQREHTRAAAIAAGIDITPADLLDEPVAAFIHALTTMPELEELVESGASRALLFDFGGGTCDVAILTIARHDAGTVAATMAGVSRYTRLGGADIDRAIVNEVLLPRLLAANGVDGSTLEWSEKARILVPQLMSTAEELKLKLSREITRLKELGRDLSDLSAETSTQVRVRRANRQNGELVLPEGLRLTSSDLERVLEQFVDPYDTTYRQGEYYDACSVMAPIESTLARAGWDADDVDVVLMAGGSSQLDAVREALSAQFSCPVLLVSDMFDTESQTEISRGAALHALSIAVSGAPVVEPRVMEALVLAAKGGKGGVTLVEAGEALPAPNAFGGVRTDLRVPADLSRGLRVELLRGGRSFFAETIELPAGTRPGDELEVWYRVDADQIVTLEVQVPARSRDKYALSLGLTWSYVHDEQSPRARVLEVENRLKEMAADAAASRRLRVELVGLYRELRFYDRAREQVRKLLATSTTDSERARVLNYLGIIEHEEGDFDSAAIHYRAAAEVGRTPWPLYNLALIQRQRNDFEGALETLDAAIRMGDAPEIRLIRAEVYGRLGRDQLRDLDLRSIVADVSMDESADADELQAAKRAAQRLGEKTAEQSFAARLAEVAEPDQEKRGALPVIAENDR